MSRPRPTLTLKITPAAEGTVPWYDPSFRSTEYPELRAATEKRQRARSGTGAPDPSHDPSGMDLSPNWKETPLGKTYLAAGRKLSVIWRAMGWRPKPPPTFDYENHWAVKLYRVEQEHRRVRTIAKVDALMAECRAEIAAYEARRLEVRKGGRPRRVATTYTQRTYTPTVPSTDIPAAIEREEPAPPFVWHWCLACDAPISPTAKIVECWCASCASKFDTEERRGFVVEVRKTLVEMAADGTVTCDSEGRYLLAAGVA